GDAARRPSLPGRRSSGVVAVAGSTDIAVREESCTGHPWSTSASANDSEWQRWRKCGWRRGAVVGENLLTYPLASWDWLASGALDLLGECWWRGGRPCATSRSSAGQPNCACCATPSRRPRGAAGASSC